MGDVTWFVALTDDDTTISEVEGTIARLHHAARNLVQLAGIAKAMLLALLCASLAHRRFGSGKTGDGIGTQERHQALVLSALGKLKLVSALRQTAVTDNCHQEDFKPIALQRMRDMESKADSHFHIFTIHAFKIYMLTPNVIPLILPRPRLAVVLHSRSVFHALPCLISYVPTHHFLHRLAWIHACGRKKGLP